MAVGSLYLAEDAAVAMELEIESSTKAAKEA